VEQGLIQIHDGEEAPFGAKGGPPPPSKDCSEVVEVPPRNPAPNNTTLHREPQSDPKQAQIWFQDSTSGKVDPNYEE
jgi:hypothetical protein